MAFNWQTFKTRTLTASVFVVVMLVGLLWNQWSFFILFSIIHFGCWWEYLKLIEKIYKQGIDIAIKYFLMITGFILFCEIGLSDYHFQFYFHVGSIFISFRWLYLIIVVGLLALIFQNKNFSIQAKWFSITGLLYISMSCGLLIDLYDQYIGGRENGGIWVAELFQIIPIAIIFSLWINDTMAYIIGSLIGKTQMTVISPKKTWEGTIAGIILSTIFIGLLFLLYSKSYLPKPLENYHWYFIAFITAVTGTLGDLFESKLKRMAGVKDSGHIMPGHGGFLDRFDSLLFATPFVWLYVYFFM